jgi:hypothetical protein
VRRCAFQALQGLEARVATAPQPRGAARPSACTSGNVQSGARGGGGALAGWALAPRDARSRPLMVQKQQQFRARPQLSASGPVVPASDAMRRFPAPSLAPTTAPGPQPLG